MTRKYLLSPESLAVLSHLHSHGHCTLAQLQAALPFKRTTVALRVRLRSLAMAAWLEHGCNENGVQHWCIHPLARGAVTVQLAPPPAPGSLVPPRRINIMAGHYVPSGFVPGRPGALDYKRCASHGQRC